MMSPDPPREDRNEDSTPSAAVTGEFVVNWDEMDDMDEMMFVPEGPHELDMGGSESEYSSDEDETNNDTVSHTRHHPPEGDNPESIESQARGYYQLLIPFPAPEQSSDSPEDGGVIEHQESDEIQENNSSVNQSVPELPATQENNELETIENNEKVEAKREIHLTEDKVETIKSVMKGFTLPSTCIPSWASELDEDAWKKQLVESIETKLKDKSDNDQSKSSK